MKSFMIILSSVVLFQTPAFAQHMGGGGGHEDHAGMGGNGNGGHEERGKGAPRAQKAPTQRQPPQINQSPRIQSPRVNVSRSNPGSISRDAFSRSPQRQVRNGVKQPIPMHSDSMGNRVTSDHLERVQRADHRSESVMHNNTRVRETVYRSNSHFVNAYRPRYQSRAVFVNNYYSSHPVIIRPQFVPYWHSHYFYGGYYYGFHPINNIEVYFYNPMVYWMYVPTYNDYYYQTWYASHYEAYPALHYPFKYHGIYYPTENLKQLLIGVSTMSVDKQVQFRAAITEFTKKVAQTLADEHHSRVKLSTGDIVINHYEILGYDESIMIEGSVGNGGSESQFKGILDLQSPMKTSVFIPDELNADPSKDAINDLNQINTKVDLIKGNTSSQPVEDEEPATPAEISADPSK